MNVLDTVMRQGRLCADDTGLRTDHASADATISELCHNQQDIENELIRLEQSINSFLKR